MKIHILKTDIKTNEELEALKPLFNTREDISRWSLDMDDVDHVLKIVTKVDREETEFIDLVRTNGFECETLPD